MKKTRKIRWRKLLKKAAEDGLRKTVELLILAIIAGVALRLVLVAVPAFVGGTIAAKLIRVKFFD